jgi:hypothetical protein
MELSPWEAASSVAIGEFPNCYRTRRFITVFTRAIHWSLFWARSNQSIPYHRIHLLTFHVPNLISIFLSLGRLSKESVQVRGPVWHFVNKIIIYSEELLVPRPTPSLRTTPCQLSTTAYSIYSQLGSISGGRLLHPKSENAPCRGDNGAS